MAAAQVLDYIKVDDFQGAESLQGNETRARVVEALKITSHTLQANRSKEGTIVTVKDLINLPREVGNFRNAFVDTPLRLGIAATHANCDLHATELRHGQASFCMSILAMSYT